MKKLTAMIITVVILMTGTMVYAADSTTTRIANRTAKINTFKTQMNELQPKLDSIKSNREKIVQLTKKANTLYKSTKQKIKKMLNSKDELKQVQVEAIKNAVNTLAQDKALLTNTTGEILKETNNLNTARRQRDIEAYKKALSNILSIQNKRIDSLTKVITDMKAIQKI